MTTHAPSTAPTRPWRWTVPFMVAALAISGPSGCYASSTTDCTPADTTYSCCLKKHREDPEACNGLEGSEVATFQTATTTATKQGAASGAKQAAAIAMAAITATAIAALVQGEDEKALDELQEELDRLMTECAEHAEQTINRRSLGEGGSPRSSATRRSARMRTAIR